MLKSIRPGVFLDSETGETVKIADSMFLYYGDLAKLLWCGYCKQDGILVPATMITLDGTPRCSPCGGW
jgi:hypothetical protein